MEESIVSSAGHGFVGFHFEVTFYNYGLKKINFKKL
jgi:hypothetical protein